MRFTRVASFSKKSNQAWATEHMNENCSVVTDGLGCFSAIEDAGCKHTVIITGGGPDSAKYLDFNGLILLLEFRVSFLFPSL
jgi:hypothetical protein